MATVSHYSEGELRGVSRAKCKVEIDTAALAEEEDSVHGLMLPPTTLNHDSTASSPSAKFRESYLEIPKQSSPNKSVDLVPKTEELITSQTDPRL